MATEQKGVPTTRLRTCERSRVDEREQPVVHIAQGLDLQHRPNQPVRVQRADRFRSVAAALGGVSREAVVPAQCRGSARARGPLWSWTSQRTPESRTSHARFNRAQNRCEKQQGKPPGWPGPMTPVGRPDCKRRTRITTNAHESEGHAANAKALTRGVLPRRRRRHPAACLQATLWPAQQQRPHCRRGTGQRRPSSTGSGSADREEQPRCAREQHIHVRDEMPQARSPAQEQRRHSGNGHNARRQRTSRSDLLVRGGSASSTAFSCAEGEPACSDGRSSGLRTTDINARRHERQGPRVATTRQRPRCAGMGRAIDMRT